MHYKRHHLSGSWPDMSPEDFQSLRDSISNVGQLESIILFEGEILDGWQRYQACIAEGMAPRFEPFQGDDPIEFISAKHTRRPLNLTQRLTAIALMHQWRPRGVKSPAKSADSADLARSADSADLTAAQMAMKAGGSTRSAENVKAAIAHGAPAVVEAMKAGALAADHAAQIAKLPKEEQAAAVAAPRAPKHRGKPKKVPAVKLVNAEIKAANASQAQTAAEERAHQLEDELRVVREQLAGAEEDIASVSKVLDADDQLATALAEAKKYRELANGLQARVLSMTTEIAELKRSVAYWEKKAKAVVA